MLFEDPIVDGFGSKDVESSAGNVTIKINEWAGKTSPIYRNTTIS